MKAAAEELLLIVLMVVGTAIIASSLTLPTITGEQRIYTVEVYSIDNALGASELYAQTAFRYSMYQGCIDSFSGGLLSQEEWMDTLNSEVSEYLKVYTRENYVFGKYSIAFSGFDVEIENVGDDLSFRTDGQSAISRMDVTASRTIELEIVDPTCLRLYRRALEIMETRTSGGATDEGVLEGWPARIEQYFVDVPSGGISSHEICEAVFEKERGIGFSDAEREIESIRHRDIEIVPSLVSYTETRNIDGTINATCSYSYNDISGTVSNVIDDSVVWTYHNGTGLFTQAPEITFTI